MLFFRKNNNPHPYSSTEAVVIERCHPFAGIDLLTSS